MSEGTKVIEIMYNDPKDFQTPTAFYAASIARNLECNIFYLK